MKNDRNCILALDLGTRCGWAYWTPVTRQPESGVQVFDLARGESPGMRYVRFSRWLQEVLDWDVWLVVYERPHLRGGYAASVLAGMETLMQTHAAVREIEYQPVHSATLKKWATGIRVRTTKMAREIGLDKSNARRALRRLLDLGIVVVKTDNKRSATYGFRLDSRRHGVPGAQWAAAD